MKISVVIPAYNASSTIRETLDSVVAQKRQADEILVMDDGSTDGTAAVVASYGPRVKLMRQENRGLGPTRDLLCRHAQGELIAFLDADDLWHPDYLQAQHDVATQHPDAVAYFAAHMNFSARQAPLWASDPYAPVSGVEVIDSLAFLRRYSAAPGYFFPSFCCVPARALGALGADPFKLRLTEDAYFFLKLLLQGAVVYNPAVLGAYRLRDGSLASNKLPLMLGETRAFELAEANYVSRGDATLLRAFYECFASQRRHCGKLLVSAGQIAEAREQFGLAARRSRAPMSITKSILWLLVSYAPSRLRPKSPPLRRQWSENSRSNKTSLSGSAETRLSGGDVEIRVARSETEVEALRELWTAWPGHRDSDIDIFLMVVRSLPEVVRPHVVVLSRGGKPESILIGRLEDKRLAFRVGYISLFQPRVRCLTFVYGAIHGNTSKENTNLLVRAVLNSLKRNEADLAMFEFVPLEAPLYPTALKVPGILSRDTLPAPQLHHSLTMPASIDDIYRKMSGERRKHIRASIRKVEAPAMGGARIACYRHLSELDLLFRDAEEIARETYQRGLGVGFSDSPAVRGRLEIGAEKGWLRGFVLYVAERPCAFWIGMLYHGSFVSEYMGYDRELRQHSPGMVLIMRALESFCNGANGDTVAELDFGLGHADYKRVLCSNTWREASVFIFSPTIKGIVLKAERTTTRLLDYAARRALASMDSLTRLKRAWRDRLAKKGPGTNSAVKNESVAAAHSGKPTAAVASQGSLGHIRKV